jgi:drug/metabolite transporter (DMT)-like permease
MTGVVEILTRNDLGFSLRSLRDLCVPSSSRFLSRLRRKPPLIAERKLMLPSTGVSFLPQIGPAAYSLTAVFLWGASDFSGGLGVRRANTFVFTAFSHLCALVLMVAIAFADNGAFPNRASLLWALTAGAIGGFSIAIFYRALASGQMGLAAPVAALLGAAIPTLVDIALEGAPRRWSILGFGFAILALWLITRPEPVGENDTAGHPKGIAAAALSGVGFAGFYLCIHQATGSATWVAAIARLGSFAATAVAILITRAPLKLDRAPAILGAFAGSLDIIACVLFIVASEHGRLDEAVVITSLYPAVTVLLARLVLKEQFSRWKFVGLLAALAAVPLIAAG